MCIVTTDKEALKCYERKMWLQNSKVQKLSCVQLQCAIIIIMADKKQRC